MPKRAVRTRGLEALERVMNKRGLKRADVARELDVDPSMVSRYLSGWRIPDRDRAVKLHELYGIPVALWTHDEDRSEHAA